MDEGEGGREGENENETGGGGGVNLKAGFVVGQRQQPHNQILPVCELGILVSVHSG